MTKPIADMIFRKVSGIWRRVDSPSQNPPTLAEILEELNIIVDDNCEFARIKQYDKMRAIWYRASAGKITITIWKINIQ